MRAAICGVAACMICMFAPFFAIKAVVERYSLYWLEDYLLIELLMCVLFLGVMGFSFSKRKPLETGK